MVCLIDSGGVSVEKAGGASEGRVWKSQWIRMRGKLQL